MQSLTRFLAVVCLFFGMTAARAQEYELLTFDNPEFFVSRIVRNAGVRPNLNSEFGRTYPTRITEASGEEANFAGRYSVDYWGCGTSCQVGAVVNLVTGEVIELPGATLGYEFQVHSALLIVNPLDDGEVLAERPDYAKPEYYLFNGRNFVQLN